MNTERWERLQSIFHDALERAPGERAAFVRSACATDPTLGDDVMAMLEEDARGDSLLDRGLAIAATSVLTHPATAALPQSPFGPYQVERALGEGGMGVVYLARRADLGTVAAIKVLRDAWLSPRRRERFAAEQRTLARFEHPGIARLYDADTLPDGTPWIAMEYVEGVSLTEYCAATNAGLTERLALFRAVCTAVQDAHRHLIIHRDLKPGNILVRGDGQVKLLDFGIAKPLADAGAEDATRTGLRLMTPAYAAPEQFAGGQVGIHTDVYSLGVILYELLSGHLPYDLSTRTPGEAERIVREGVAERPSVMARKGGTPGRLAAVRTSDAAWRDLDVLCLTAMHQEPARRYPTVDALVRDVESFVQGRPLAARADSVRYRLGKYLRRNARVVTTIAAGVAAIIAVSGVAALRLARARDAAVAEVARTQRVQQFMLDLFQGGDEAVGPADSLRVVTLVERGVETARQLDREPAIQGELYHTLGELQRKLGKLDEADSLLRRALRQRETLHGPRHADVLTTRVALGALRIDQARFDEAEQELRGVLADAPSFLPPRHPLSAAATAQLARALEERGHFDAAIPVAEEAVQLQRAIGGETAELASALSTLANIHFYAGHHSVSDSINRQALALTQQIFGDRHPLVADDLINLGAIQQEMGNYAEAERRLREGLSLVEEFYGEDHYRTAAALSMLSRPLISQRRLEEAQVLVERALAIQERVYGPGHWRVASLLNDLAIIATIRDDSRRALALFTRVHEIWRATYGERSSRLGIVLANMASAYHGMGDYRRAETVFREALAMYAATLPERHINIGIAQTKLGRTLLRAGRLADAERMSMAGYTTLVDQVAPANAFLQNARRDLAEIYEALGRGDEAARFRAEVASAQAPAAR